MSPALKAAVVSAPAGELAVRSRAVDRAGNVEEATAAVRVVHAGGEGVRYQLHLPLILHRAPLAH